VPTLHEALVGQSDEAVASPSDARLSAIGDPLSPAQPQLVTPESTPSPRGGEGRGEVGPLAPPAAQVRSTLVLANANDPGDKTLSLVPSRFSALVPKFKASDYDYIIFDMPPVSSTSPTASLASMLDMTF